MKKIRSFFGNESGVILIFVTLSMVALLSVTALATDLGIAYYQKNQLQIAVDSAALAAVHDLPDANKATATVKSYIEKNGFSSDEVSVSFDATNFTCNVYCKIEMDTIFANVFDTSSMDMSAKAKAKLFKTEGHHSAVYDYCIFSGDESATLRLGGTFDIYGSVHSNGLFDVSPSHGYIKNALEASHGGTFNQWTATAGTIVYNSPVIQMPDFTSCVEQTLPATYNTVLTGGTKRSVTVLNGNVMITSSVKYTNTLVVNGNLFVNGNLTVGGGAPALVLNGGTIFCTGAINSTSSSYINGGCVYAGGNINLQGGYNSFITSASIAIYSSGGSITMSASNTAIYGIIYAPAGNISITGNNLSFYGNLIGKTITGIPSVLSIGENTFDLPFDIGAEGSTSAILIE